MAQIPYREADLNRPRARQGKAKAFTVTKGIARPVDIPEADPNWHPIALMLWESLLKSGQADFYQQSDWAFAYSLCEDLTHYKNAGRRSSQMLATIYSAMGNLLITEGDRRKVHIELSEAPVEDDAALHVIADYKARLGANK